MLTTLLLYSSSKEISSLPLVKTLSSRSELRGKLCFLVQPANKDVYFWSTGIIVYVLYFFFPPCGMKKSEIPFELTQL